MSARVLVADGDVDRGKRIAEACAGRGLACRLVTHGAAALETALAERPDALVSQLDLPLIDGPKLAAILRANPRTRSLRVLFIGDRVTDGDRRGSGDAILAPPIEPDEIAAAVQSAITESGGTEAPGEEGGVEGQLAQLPLADLLELFHVSRKTGTVELVRSVGRARRQVGRVYLRGGDVVAASVGNAASEKALFRLLAWDRGSFSFQAEAVDVEPTLRTPTRTLLREGLRQAREWERMAVELPPMGAQLALKIPRAALPNVIHPLTQDVLMVLDLYSRVRDVVDHSAYPDYQVLRTLHTLIQRGMVEMTREPNVAELNRELRLFSPARTARLREWLGIDRHGALAARDAKVVVVGANGDATRDFTRLLERLPGVEISQRSDGSTLGVDDLGLLARVSVDAEVGIDIVHAPADPRFAALWPAVGHRALATLLLLSGPVSDAVARVRRLAESLETAPGARVFHLLLLEKGQRVEPDDLRENLSIVDGGSLFLIPVENTEKAGVLLREMFGRILP